MVDYMDADMIYRQNNPKMSNVGWPMGGQKEDAPQSDPGDENGPLYALETLRKQDAAFAAASETPVGEDPKPYVDQTGTNQKPNPLRDVYLEFPRAMECIAKVTAYGATKHAPRGWRTFEHGYALGYHQSKVGRHLLAEELEGPINYVDGNLYHPAQAAWNQLAYLEHFLEQEEENNR